MAPSASDYEGALRGLALLAVPSLLVLAIFAMVTSNNQAVINNLVELMSPLFAVLLLTTVLCAIVTLIVYLLTSFFPRVYRSVPN